MSIIGQTESWYKVRPNQLFMFFLCSSTLLLLFLLHSLTLLLDSITLSRPNLSSLNVWITLPANTCLHEKGLDMQMLTWDAPTNPGDSKQLVHMVEAFEHSRSAIGKQP